MTTRIRRTARITRGAALALLGVLALSCARTRRPEVILCAGDSITELGYPDLLRKLLRQEGFRARVVNRGRKGFNSGEYLAFLSSKENDFALIHPDFVLLELGTNDVRVDGDRTPAALFEANMRAIIERLRRLKDGEGRPSVVLLATIPPVPESEAFPFSPDSSRRVRDEINPALKRLAAEFGLTLVDQYSVLAGAPELLPGVHPSREGYRRMAGTWLRALEPRLRPTPRG